MRTPKTLASGLLLLLLAAAPGCDDDDPVAPEPGRFTVTLSDLPALDSGHYEAWMSFPEEDGVAGGLGTEHDETFLVSLGAFRVNAAGDVEALDGGAMTFAHSGPENLSLAVEILISVQADSDSTGPILLGGDVTGDDRNGNVTLRTSYSDALDADLTQSSGTCVLSTPSDDVPDNENQGLWFVDLSGGGTPVRSLALPPLGEGWIYQAWIERGGVATSLGRISNTGAPDSDGAGPDAGPLSGYDLPGSDFVNPPLDLADGTTQVFVTVEDERRDENAIAPFPIRALTGAIPAGAEVHQSLALSRPSAPLPTGSAHFTR